MALVLVIVSLLLIGFIAGAVHLAIALRNAVPYVTAPPEALAEIVAALELPRTGELWDLGCGDGRVLQAARVAEPELSLAGVDNNPMPLILARRRLGGQARLVRGDIMNVDLTRASRVFAYLGPGLMAELEKKFAKELPKGARVVSMQFPMPHRKPTQVITLEHGRPYAAKLYVYDY